MKRTNLAVGNVLNIRNIADALLVILPLLFWLLSSYPAKLSGDSIDILRQARQGEINDWYPVTYVLLVDFFSVSGKYPAFVSILQLLLVTCTLYLVIGSFCFSMSKRNRLRLVSILMLTPMFGGMAVTLWKDIPYACFTAIGITLISRDVRQELNRFGWFLISFGSVFHHEGPVACIVISILLLAWKILRKLRKPIHNSQNLVGLPIRFAACGVIGTLISMSAVVLSDADPKPRWQLTMNLLADLQYVNAQAGDALPPSTKRILDSISSGDSLTGARSCASINGMVFNDGFDFESANENALRMPSIWLDTLFSNQGKLLIKAHLCRAEAFLPPPIAWGPAYVYWLVQEQSIDNNQSISQGIPEALTQLEHNWTGLWIKYLWFLGWPGLHLLTAVLALLFAKRIYNVDTSIPMVYVVGHALTLVVSTPAQDFRYAFSWNFISIGIACLLFSSRTTLGTARVFRRPKNYEKRIEVN